MRVGYGYDIHALVAGKGPLRLGGIDIDAPLELRGHSDGDVLLHALADGILGAAGMGDLGLYFPSGDHSLRGADSSQFVARALELAETQGLVAGNVDVTVIAGRPRLDDFQHGMMDSLVLLTGLDEAKVNVKLKSNDGFGAVGRGEAIAAHAIVLLEELDQQNIHDQQ